MFFAEVKMDNDTKQRLFEQGIENLRLVIDLLIGAEVRISLKRTRKVLEQLRERGVYLNTSTELDFEI